MIKNKLAHLRRRTSIGLFLDELYEDRNHFVGTSSNSFQSHPIFRAFAFEKCFPNFAHTSPDLRGGESHPFQLVHSYLFKSFLAALFSNTKFLKEIFQGNLAARDSNHAIIPAANAKFLRTFNVSDVNA
jgi:hypothetical protein